jgi:hypothetical protein
VDALDAVEAVLGLGVDGAAGVVGVEEPAPSLEDTLSLEDAVASALVVLSLLPRESVL